MMLSILDFVKTTQFGRYCRGCRIMCAMSIFPYGGSGFEVECKYVLDAIFKVAKAQGQVVWFQACKASDEKVFYMISHYVTHREMIQAGEKAHTKWQIMLCKEYIQYQSELVTANIGELMCRRRFIQWASNPTLCTWENVLSFEEAGTLWGLWVTDPRGNNVYAVKIGDVQYVRVETTIQMSSVQRIIRGKSIEGTTRSVKAPSIKDVEKATARLNMNHDHFGGMQFDMDSHAEGLIANMGANFEGIGAALTDVTKLLPEEPLEADDEEDPNKDEKDDQAANDDEDDDDSQPPPDEKDEKFADYNHYCLTKERTLEYQIDGILDKFDSEFKLLKALVAPLSQMTVEERQKYCRELTLTNVVIECAEAAMGEKIEEFTKAKAKYTSEVKEIKDDDKASSSAASSGHHGAIASAPPTATFGKMKHLLEMKALPKLVHCRIQATSDYKVLALEVKKDTVF